MRDSWAPGTRSLVNDRCYFAGSKSRAILGPFTIAWDTGSLKTILSYSNSLVSAWLTCENRQELKQVSSIFCVAKIDLFNGTCTQANILISQRAWDYVSSQIARALGNSSNRHQTICWCHVAVVYIQHPFCPILCRLSGNREGSIPLQHFEI